MAKRLVNGVWVDEPDVQTTGTQTGDTQSGTDWLGKMNELMDKYNNRDPFKYDLNSDALYQNYRNQYVLQGQKAMADTMGQAAALTGGYANSYAQNVGQQAYGDYLTKLNAVVPELYAQARSEYDKQGDDLLNQLSLAKQMYGIDYDRQRDALADQRYQDELAWDREWQQRQWDYNTQQQAQSDARSYATYLLQMGIMPNADQLAAAGISPEEASKIINYYTQIQTGKTGKDYYGPRNTDDTGKDTGDELVTDDAGNGKSLFDALSGARNFLQNSLDNAGHLFRFGDDAYNTKLQETNTQTPKVYIPNTDNGTYSYDELRTWLLRDMNSPWTATKAGDWNARLDAAHKGKTISDAQYKQLKAMILNGIGAYNT